MNINQKDIDIIDAYLKGDLNADDTKAVEARLSVDADFAALHQWLRTVAQGSRLFTLRQKQDFLRSIERKTALPQKKSSTSPKYLWIFLLLLVCMLLFIWIFQSRKAAQLMSNESTYETTTKESENEPDEVKKDTIKAEKPEDNIVKEKPDFFAGNDNNSSREFSVTWKSLYSVSSMLVLVLRSSDSNDSTLYSTALKKFLDKRYSDAINILSDDPYNQENQYLMAHSLLLSGKHAQAASIFKTFTQNEFSLYYNDAQWYHILALYADYPATRPQLKAAFQNISDMPDSYHKGLETIRKICKC